MGLLTMMMTRWSTDATVMLPAHVGETRRS
jgi:hypothetical protein